MQTILAIETSCDETAVAVVQCSGEKEAPRFSVLGDALYSQASKHAEFGGVYPNLAKREHQQNLIPLLEKALDDAGLLKDKGGASGGQHHSHILKNVRMVLAREPELLKQFEAFVPTIEKPPVDAIAVTFGPGLEPALWVGLNLAKALSHYWQIPLVPINHMEGHIVSVLVDRATIAFPALALLVSGGHTELVLMNDWFDYTLLGQTRDDAVGEAFDKVARLLGLPYPGGPEISRFAQEARDAGLQVNKKMHLPRPMIDSDDYDFSFSGLKTAVRYMVQERPDITKEEKQKIAREFEGAAVEVLVAKTRRALEDTGAKTLIAAGGVIANAHLRKTLEKMIADSSAMTLLMPPPSLAGDNAVMIGSAGCMRFEKNPEHYTPVDDTLAQNLRANGTLSLTQP